MDPLEQRVWIAGVETELSAASRRADRADAHPGTWSPASSSSTRLGGRGGIRSNAIEVHVSRLRARLEASEDVVIRTLRGVATGSRPSVSLWHGSSARPIVTRLVLAVAAAMALILLCLRLRLLEGGVRPEPSLDQDLRPGGVVGPAVAEGRRRRPTPRARPTSSTTWWRAAGGNSWVRRLLTRAQVEEVAGGRSVGFDIGRVFPISPSAASASALTGANAAGGMLVAAAISGKHDEACESPAPAADRDLGPCWRLPGRLSHRSASARPGRGLPSCGRAGGS